MPGMLSTLLLTLEDPLLSQAYVDGLYCDRRAFCLLRPYIDDGKPSALKATRWNPKRDAAR